MKKNVLITLFALILLSLMSCKTEAGLKENEIAVDTTQFELVPKNALEDVETQLKEFALDNVSARAGITNYIQFANHEFIQGQASSKLGDKIPVYHVLSVQHLTTILKLLEQENADNIVISQFNDKTFNPANPYDVNCKLIFFGMKNNYVINRAGTNLIYYLNEMKRCPPDNGCSNINFPVPF